MEKVDRIARTDNGATKSYCKETNRQHVGGRQLRDEMGLRDKRTIRMGTTEEEEEEDEDEEEQKTRQHLGLHYVNAGTGLCAICHFTIGKMGPGDMPVGYGTALSCSQGHLFCHQCIQRFAIRSDMGCVLCGASSHNNSNSSCSRDSSSSLNRTNTRSTRAYETQEQVSPPAVEELHVNPWLQGYYSSARGPGNSTIYCNNVNRVDSNSDWEPEFGDTREERTGKVTSQHQQRSYCNIVKKEDPDTKSEIRINGQGISECSRRPIRCPRLDCAVNVAFSALTHHFLFDHPEVPILSVEPGAKSTLIVSFAALSCDSSRCLALLLVSGKLSGPAARLFSGNQIHPKYRNRLPLPVLAARLHCTSRYTSHDEAHGHEENRSEGDVIIAWVAGLDIANSTSGALRCSIQAVDDTDNEGFRSLTYTGPVNSLRTAQRPREVFLTGDCVILHEGLINHITSGCSNLNVNVIVH